MLWILRAVLIQIQNHDPNPHLSVVLINLLYSLYTARILSEQSHVTPTPLLCRVISTHQEQGRFSFTN